MGIERVADNDPFYTRHPECVSMPAAPNDEPRHPRPRSAASLPLPDKHHVDPSVAVAIGQFGKGRLPGAHLQNPRGGPPAIHPAAGEFALQTGSAPLIEKSVISALAQHVDEDLDGNRDPSVALRLPAKDDVARRTAMPPRGGSPARGGPVDGAPVGDDHRFAATLAEDPAAVHRRRLLAGRTSRNPEAARPRWRQMAGRDVEAAPGGASLRSIIAIFPPFFGVVVGILYIVVDILYDGLPPAVAGLPLCIGRMEPRDQKSDEDR